MTEDTRPAYDTVSLYEALADRLNRDPEWSELGAKITYTMVYRYEAPVNRAFYLNFERGRVVEVTEIEDPNSRSADFVISGTPEAWKSVLRSETKPTVAMATGKLKVDGRQLTLLKHMSAFSHLLKVMTQLDPLYD